MTRWVRQVRNLRFNGAVRPVHHESKCPVPFSDVSC